MRRDWDETRVRQGCKKFGQEGVNHFLSKLPIFRSTLWEQTLAGPQEKRLNASSLNIKA